MSSLNKVQLIGHLGADPEFRSFQNGGEVANLRVATSESWRGKDGQRQERTEWHTVAVFSPHLVAFAEKVLRKGSQVYVEGKLQTRKWQDRESNDRYSTEIVVERFGGELKILGSRDQGERGGSDRDGDREYGRQHDDGGCSGGQRAANDEFDDVPF